MGPDECMEEAHLEIVFGLFSPVDEPIIKRFPAHSAGSDPLALGPFPRPRDASRRMADCVRYMGGGLW